MQLALIGVGLIGGSAALAMKQKGIFTAVRGFDLSAESLQKALSMGVIDVACGNIEEAVRGADAVLVAVPVLAMKACFEALAPALSEHAYITDVGSTRCGVIAAARAALGEKFANYAPVHPIAGGEMPGVEFAREDLFEDARAISTPAQGMSDAAVGFWEKVWEKVGSIVVRLTPEDHDLTFAQVSHLPHLLSYVMVKSILREEDYDRRLSFAGAGFRDFTRIAASSPRMWTDICMANREAVLDALTAFESDLASAHELVQRGNAKELYALFERASQARRHLFEHRNRGK